VVGVVVVGRNVGREEKEKQEIANWHFNAMVA
jgi:hypothetical protein